MKFGWCLSGCYVVFSFREANKPHTTTLPCASETISISLCLTHHTCFYIIYKITPAQFWRSYCPRHFVVIATYSSASEWYQHKTLKARLIDSSFNIYAPSDANTVYHLGLSISWKATWSKQQQQQQQQRRCCNHQRPSQYRAHSQYQLNMEDHNRSFCLTYLDWNWQK